MPFEVLIGKILDQPQTLIMNSTPFYHEYSWEFDKS